MPILYMKSVKATSLKSLKVSLAGTLHGYTKIKTVKRATRNKVGTYKIFGLKAPKYSPEYKF